MRDETFIMALSLMYVRDQNINQNKKFARDSI